MSKCDCGIDRQGHAGVHLSGCPASMTDFNKALSAAAIEWTIAHMEYADPQQVRDMCATGRSQTYKTALHFADWARRHVLESGEVARLIESVRSACERYEKAEAKNGSDLARGMTTGVHHSLSSALVAFEKAKREAGK